MQTRKNTSRSGEISVFWALVLLAFVVWITLKFAKSDWTLNSLGESPSPPSTQAVLATPAATIPPPASDPTDGLPFAVLDDTTAQVERKLGTHRFSYVMNGRSVRLYIDTQKNLNHQITFLNGKAVSIQYARNNETALSQTDIQEFMDGNSGGELWEPLGEPGYWTMDGSGIVSSIMEGSPHMFSVVYTAEMEAWKQFEDSPIRELTQGAAAGDTDSLVDLAFRTLQGDGVEQNNQQAFALLLDAANQGNAIAQRAVGYMYSMGEGVQCDMAKGFKWTRQAAEQGDAQAQCNLGSDYKEGRGVPVDYGLAAQWFTKAAEQGLDGAQFTLGLMHREGVGVPVDMQQAVYWHTKAAEHDFADSQYELGRMFHEGEGVPVDMRKAGYWYTKAAEQDHVRAQVNLANMYYSGEGTAPNVQKAVQLLQKAADNGSQEASNNLKAIEHNARVMQGQANAAARCKGCNGGGKAYESLIGGVWIPYPEPRRELGYRVVTCSDCGGTGKARGARTSSRTGTPSSAKHRQNSRYSSDASPFYSTSTKKVQRLGGGKSSGAERWANHRRNQEIEARARERERQANNISPAATDPPQWQVRESPSKDGTRVFEENQYLAQHNGRFGGAFNTAGEAREKARALNTQQTYNVDAMKAAVVMGGSGSSSGSGNWRMGKWKYTYDESLNKFVVYQE